MFVKSIGKKVFWRVAAKEKPLAIARGFMAENLANYDTKGVNLSRLLHGLVRLVSL
jgi:hypothetical protein